MCLTTVILAPGARSGVGNCGPCATLGRSAACRGLPGLAADEFREANFCRQVADMRAIRPELEVHFRSKSKNMALSGPRHPSGSQGHPQGHPKGNQVGPKSTQGHPQGTPKAAKGRHGRAPWEPKARQLDPQASQGRPLMITNHQGS